MVMGVDKDDWIIPHRLDHSDEHRWPSAADLDAVAEEQRIKELTNGKTDQQGS